ncbi:MAG TPA: acyl-CoA thioesterase [Acidobacteria bacterium]|nr:acyl-CoA thioesterase [Acidobacteriota bacterium]
MEEQHRPGPEWEAARFRVRYAETDAAGIVHHATYLVWFEEGRSELSRQLGLPYRELEEAGVVLVVVEARVRYVAGARYDEAVEVWTRMEQVRSRSCTFSYRVVASEDGRLLATGSTSHVAVDRVTGRPIVLPEPFRSTYAAAAAPTESPGYEPPPA